MFSGSLISNDEAAPKSLSEEAACSPKKVTASGYIPKLTLAKSPNGQFSVRVINSLQSPSSADHLLTEADDPYELPDDPANMEDPHHPPILTDSHRLKRHMLPEDDAPTKISLDATSPKPPVLLPMNEEEPESSQRYASPIITLAPLPANPVIADKDDDIVITAVT